MISKHAHHLENKLYKFIRLTLSFVIHEQIDSKKEKYMHNIILHSFTFTLPMTKMVWIG